MDIDDIRRAADEIAKHNIQRLSFFNLGEPFLANDIKEQLNIIRTTNPHLNITISTNGALLNTHGKREAAMLVDHIVVSIDGTDDKSMNKYQRGASFQRVYQNIKDLIEFRNNSGLKRPIIEWKYVLFNWNDKEKEIRKAIDLARAAKVDIISFWPTRTPVYGISWRYYLNKFYRNLGMKTWKGREVLLEANKPPDLPRGSFTTSGER
jgi:wyosine [tRNA(Phe)-imidazoG37] synthetase (radical SAM superfamily)